MTLRLRFMVLTALGLTLLMASVAQAETMTYPAYYTDELTLSNFIEAHGITYGGRHKAIDTASCTGLRRYGVHTSAYDVDKFHRFSCEAFGPDNHIYKVQVSTTLGPDSHFWYFHPLTVKLEL